MLLTVCLGIIRLNQEVIRENEVSFTLLNLLFRCLFIVVGIQYSIPVLTSPSAGCSIRRFNQ